MADLAVLDILLHGKPAGKLLELCNGRTLFDFDESYLADEGRPAIGLSFYEGVAGGAVGRPGQERNRLAPFFSNLLPEGPMREWLARQAGVAPEREFALLGALGDDLPGAVTVHHAGEGREESAMMRFSLPGMQAKFPAIADARTRLAVPEQGGGGNWIVKLPSPRWPKLPENEYTMTELARRAGIAVPETRLVPLADIQGLPEEFGSGAGTAFAARRFDRAQGASVHTEDFAQVFGIHPERKYNRGSLANIAQVLSRTTSSGSEWTEFIRRIVFNALIGNANAHLKNWSLAYPDKRAPALSPAYDLVSTVAYLPADIMSLKVSRSKAFADFSKGEILHLAERAALPGKAVWGIAKETIQLFHEAWAGNAGDLPVDNGVRSAIDRHIATLPMVKEA